MSRALLGRERFFEWDRFVGTQMTPVDAVQNAREENKTFTQYAEEFARNNPSEDIETQDLVDGMVSDMIQAAHNLATFRVTGSPVLGPYSTSIFAKTPHNPDEYYLWVATADAQEIIDKVTADDKAEAPANEG